MVRIADHAADLFTADTLAAAPRRQSFCIEFAYRGDTLVDNQIDFAPIGGTDVESFLYSDYDSDPATAFQYNHTRWCDPTTGVYLSTDPVGYCLADANFYPYIDNDPTNAAD